MSKKPILTVAATLVATLAIAAIVLTPQSNTKRRATRIGGVNNVCASFGLTNHTVTNQLPVLKP